MLKPHASGNSSHLSGLTIHVRELCTRAPIPDAPSLESLFDSAQGTAVQQTVVLWEPAHNWPGFSAAQLVHGQSPKVTEVRLRQEQVDNPLALLQYTAVPTPDGRNIGVVWVKAAATDALAARVALTLLEQADHAVILAGGSNDRELERQVSRYVKSHRWSGPRVVLLSSAEKPSRAQRLRRFDWPKAFAHDVLETYPSSEPDWSLQLLSRILRPTPIPSRPTLLDQPSPPALSVKDPILMPASVATELIESGLARRCVDLVSEIPGVLACAVTDVTRQQVLAQSGDADVLDDASRETIALWRAYEALEPEEPMRELLLSAGNQHRLALPIDRHPGALLVAVVSSEAGDLAQIRWQLGVARNHLN